MRRGDCASAKVIRRFRAAKRQLHVRMGIDAAGNYQLSGSINRGIGLHIKLSADHRNDFIFDQDVGVVVVSGGDDLAITN